MRERILLTILAVALAGSPALGETFTVTLKAVDADGKPVAKAEAATLWDGQASLTAMLEPLGLTVEVRHEVVFVTVRTK